MYVNNVAVLFSTLPKFIKAHITPRRGPTTSSKSIPTRPKLNCILHWSIYAQTLIGFDLTNAIVVVGSLALELEFSLSDFEVTLAISGSASQVLWLL